MKVSPILLPILLNKFRKRIDATCRDLLTNYNLSKLHLLYLMALYEYSDGLSLKELTELLGFDKANTTRAVSQLIQKGYADKQTQGDLEHKFKVVLSENGKLAAGEIWEHNQKQNLDILKLLTQEEMIALGGIMEKLWVFLSYTPGEFDAKCTEIT